MLTKKKLIGVATGIVIILGLIGSSGNSDTAVKSSISSRENQSVITPIEKPHVSVNPVTIAPTVTNVPTATPTPTKYIAPTKYVAPTATSAQDQVSGLSNDDYYTNVDGNQVHSPAYSNSVPAGATAICGDGTYSFSQNRRGTCSHHGGVAQWL